IEAGVVYQPTKDMLYYAEKNKGSTIYFHGEEKKLSVENAQLANLQVSFNAGTSKNTAQRMFQGALLLIPHVLRVRQRPSCTLTVLSVVTNISHAAFNCSSKIWDIAAAKIIIEE